MKKYGILISRKREKPKTKGNSKIPRVQKIPKIYSLNLSSIQKISAILKCSSANKQAVNLTGKGASPMASSEIITESLPSVEFACSERLF